jgi:chaperonin GroEL
LASGVALIRVGAPTEVELIEKKHRIEDALEAVRAAREEGVVPGGGVALIRASKGVSITLTNEDQRIGAMCVLDAVRQPLRQMAINGGESPDIIEHIVMSQPDHFGYDFRNQREADLYEEGIIDPVKVTKCALRNAASAAGTLLTTNYAIVEKE